MIQHVFIHLYQLRKVIKLPLTEQDIVIINALQGTTFNDDLFTNIANRLSLSPEKLLEKLEDLKKRGILRRWGVFLNSRTLGYNSALIALQLPENKIEKLENWIRNEKGVTHCYVRRFFNKNGSVSNHELASFNIWLTLTCLNKNYFHNKVNRLQREIEIDYNLILILPSQKKFKLRVPYDIR